MGEARAARVTGERQIEMTTAPVPTAEPGGVVVRIRYCGVCGTDVHGYEQPGMLPPAVFGHEWTGTVAEVGDGVESVAVGDRVVVAVGPACGRCSMCRSGHPDHCDTAFLEANGATPDAPDHGGFATHLAVSDRRVLRLVDEVTDEQAALIEPTAVTLHAVRRTQVPLGATVVVQGAGPIGLLTAQHARRAGAGRVLVVEPVEVRQEAARGLGFDEVFAPGEAFTTALQEATERRGADVLLECTGVARLLQPSAELVRRGGTLSLVGYPTDLSEVSYSDWVARELRVVASLAYLHEDFVGAMDAIARGQVDVAPLITGTFGLDELPDVLTELGSGHTSHAKVLIDPAA
jgi:(R,R)-butanediol dehydrogenase / meso-butanediol dehydrogenase / diacetyl reductase